eukprot:CAMPEP_0181477606 /NCGR_PEP_ID=MMETSP1110-20121109/42302_1 /TAXON_ID=174948 /ORGANISM="Symbiodinium sp., Strain CCMP421" /LENGTH=844 /DNA_ID=CAMNT_0023602911 /DNA_START=54 /DNA_END=2585 /DNA_ORIENTATION=-
MSGGHLSKEFFELVKSIGESRSKQEEDKIIVGEIAILKQHLSGPNISAKKMKEYMIRAVYAEMLGHDASFAYIHAVKLTHEKNLFAKRIGYLTCNLFLHRDHELMLLLINTMQRDLQSANHIEVCSALASVCRLVNVEMIPAISPLVFKLLNHPQEAVRKKAVIAVHKFFKIVPETVLDQKDQIRKVLCDPDPSVMGASLHVLCEIAKAHPAASKDLVPSFVSILKQITEHRLPRDFDYHRMPAPWLQVKLLSILGVLGTADKATSEHMYEILQECMRRADSGVNVGYAIIYECVKCITKIFPDHGLLELAASNISRFISSENHNLRYLGVTGLAQIVQVSPAYAAEHQMVVVDCLEDPDETLKRKTLDLLFRMTNPQNVVVVVDKLSFHLRTSVDSHLRRDLAQKITSLAERFAPDNEWYVNTMNTVFELSGELVPAETAYNLMRLVAEGTGEDDAADNAFRVFAVNTYLKLLEKPSLSDILVQVIAWVLGEYARLANVDGYTIEDIADLLLECIERPFEDPATRGYLVTALMKLIGQHGVKSSSAEAIIRSYRSSRMTDLQQRCYEFEQLRQSPALMRKVLPYDASCEDITVNKDLAFLSAFVQQKLDEGAKPYQSALERAARAHDGGTQKVEVESKPTLNFQPYEAPSKPQPTAFPAAGLEPSHDGGGGGSAADAAKGLNVSGPRKWGPAGYNQPGGNQAPQAPPPVEKPPDSFVSHAPPSAPSRAVPKAHEAPVMTEKQRMAAALFGGVGPGQSQAPAPKASEPKAPARPKAAPAPEAPASVDLLDFDDGFAQPVPTQPAPSPQPVSPPVASASPNLLDFDDGSPTLAPAPAPAAATPAA